MALQALHDQVAVCKVSCPQEHRRGFTPWDDAAPRPGGGYPTGFTLVELLIALGLAGILLLVVTAVLSGALEIFRFGGEETALQSAEQQIMTAVVDGGFEAYGLRDGLAIVEAAPTSIGVVPLWVDEHQRVVQGVGRYPLNRPFQIGSPAPLVEVAMEGGTHRPVQAGFILGEADKRGRHPDVIELLEPFPAGTPLRISFYPDPVLAPDTVLRFVWDPGAKRLTRQYAGVTSDLVGRDHAARVTAFRPAYLDNFNRVLELAPEARPVPEHLQAISAIRLTWTLERGDQRREAMAVVNLRGRSLAGGLHLSEGMALPIPNSQEIRALLVRDLQGVETGNRLVIEIASEESRRYTVTAIFSREGMHAVIGQLIAESPPGTVVWETRTPLSIEKGINLLAFDPSGRFDYDDDARVEDAVLITGQPTLRVVQSDILGARLFVRP